MRLDFNAFKMIKPDDVVDDYIAGQDSRGNNKMSNIELGKLYRVSVFNLLKSKPNLTVFCMSEMLGFPLKAIASVAQKMERDKQIVFTKKVKSKNNRMSRAFKAGNKLILD